MQLRLLVVALPVVFACSSTPAAVLQTDAGPGDSSPQPDGGGVTTPCTLKSQGTAGTLLQGRVLAPSGPIDGEVLVDTAGKIACVDTSCAQAAGYAQATVISCTGSVISPGLVNAHDHTNFATIAPEAHGQTRWLHRQGWRTGAGGEPPLLPAPKSTTDVTTIAGAELRFVLGGATTILSSGGVSGLLRNVADFKNPQELEGLTGKTAFFDTFPLGDSNGTELASGCAYPSVRTVGAAFADGVYAPHIAEGINPAAENEFLCLKDTLVTSRTAIIHGVGLTATDVDQVQQHGAMLIWSPRSNIDLYGNTAPVTVFKNAGIPIALGTDWLPSGSMNMLRELACADSLNQRNFGGAFSAQDLWAMATKGSAKATGFGTQIGELVVGEQADIAVFDGRSGADYAAVIRAGVEDVHVVMRGGKILYGDTAVTSAIGTGCADLDVCGEKKQVCLDVPSVTLAAIQQVTQPIYPLFFCKEQSPAGEPSCVPYRDTYPDGTSATDHDGDGVADAADDCPDVFNPPRPLDNGKQSDVDGDGAGDACDPKPLDPSVH
ncbi:MAG TPA: amidohydrolase family protein [Polyangiaceae bacterium]